MKMWRPGRMGERRKLRKRTKVRTRERMAKLTIPTLAP
jgi:hypothetical protein